MSWDNLLILNPQRHIHKRCRQAINPVDKDSIVSKFMYVDNKRRKTDKMKLFIIPLLLLCNTPICKCFGQDNKTIVGTWIFEKVKIDNQVLTENLDADTLKFTDTKFEQNAIVQDEQKNKFLWTQSGKYRFLKNKLILSNRISSEGEPGKEYPEIQYKYKFKGDQLILIETTKLNDTFWRYYKKIN